MNTIQHTSPTIQGRFALINYTEAFAPVTTWALDSLKLAQRNFNKNPNAFHWNLCVRAMLVHQQLGIAVRSEWTDRSKLSFDLDNNPIGQWGDIICRATMGKDVHELIVLGMTKQGDI